MQPLAMKVLTTGMPWARDSSRSSLAALPRITPLPAKMSGNDAASMRRAADCRAWRSGDGRRGRSVDSGSPSAGSSATSSGTSTWQAPGFSASATLKALRMTSGITTGISARVFHFVSGRMCSTMSTILVRFLVDAVAPGLAGDGDQRRVVEVGVGHPGDQVGGARARGWTGRRPRGR